ncbi:hypothetical protein Tco_1410786 [Tanacetum coccineum]
MIEQVKSNISVDFHDHLIGIGFVLDFVEFISFTFSDKEMILVIEAVLFALIVYSTIGIKSHGVFKKVLCAFVTFVTYSIIPLGQKNTLAEYMILSGADNRPPMLDKDLYYSWKSRMELYMQNKEHERMILESVENGLPADIYSLVNQHRVAKDLWKRVQLLMQGTSLTKKERECKLYDAFNKFTHIKGELLHKYNLRFTQLINDMNIYNMKMEQFQLHAYLEQHKLHANEVRLLRERNQDPLAFVANQQMTPPHFNTYQSSYNNPQPQQQFPPYQYGSIHPTQHYSSTYPSQP